MIHKLSDVRSKKIGKGTNVWQYSVILENAEIGSNCNICSSVFIENNVKVGNNVTVKNGSNLYDGLIIEDNVFIGPNVVFTNDKYPKSGVKRDLSNTKWLVGEGSSIGANSTILPDINIGKNCLIGAGSLVNKNIPDNSTAYGNPIKIKQK